MAVKTGNESGHEASARMRNLPISTKHSIEISKHLRFKSSAKAKEILEGVIAKKSAIPFVRFTMDMGHKAGMRSGRYPVKAATEFLRLIKSVEKNAEDLGLDTANLKITHLLANKASIPMTGKRNRGATKRTHLEVKVREGAAEKKTTKKAPVKKAKVEKAPAKKEVKKAEVKETKEQESNNDKQEAQSQ